MKRAIVILILCLTNLGFAQQKNKKKLERTAREEVRKGNKLYNQLKFKDAEVAYKKALDDNPNYPKASYNLANAMYQQNRTKEAVSQYELVEKTFKDKMSKAEAFHNMGNSYMKAKQYVKAVDAFKNSLRNNPKDDETRYNLALAQKLLKNQQQQNKNNKNNKNKKNNKDNKDNKNKNQKDKNKDNKKDKNKGKDKKDDKGDSKKKNPKDQQKQPPKPRPNQLSPEQIKQLLDAMNNEENKTQKKLNAKKATAKKIKQEKDW